MTANAIGIVLLTIAILFCGLEIFGLVRSIIKKRKEKKEQTEVHNDD